ncbi:MAG: DUF2188 domain-containing protein [Erysipelotrichaceae bacterium]|nr:DUF2188 domain-containing protein [Erysipelotrichaceae bacterium]
MSRKSIHVTYRKSDGQWHVCNGANGTSTGKYQTQKEAIGKGRKLAMEASAEFCVHGKDGKIRLSTSYGNDPENSMKYKKNSKTTKRRSK